MKSSENLGANTVDKVFLHKRLGKVRNMLNKALHRWMKRHRGVDSHRQTVEMRMNELVFKG